MPVTFGGGPLPGREGIESYVREVSDTWEEYRVIRSKLGLRDATLVSLLAYTGSVANPRAHAGLFAEYDERNRVWA
jgi:hypothetical protein